MLPYGRHVNSACQYQFSCGLVPYISVNWFYNHGSSYHSSPWSVSSSASSASWFTTKHWVNRSWYSHILHICRKCCSLYYCCGRSNALTCRVPQNHKYNIIFSKGYQEQWVCHGGIGLVLISSHQDTSPIHIGRGQCLEDQDILHDATWVPGNSLTKHAMRVLQLFVGGNQVWSFYICSLSYFTCDIVALMLEIKDY